MLSREAELQINQHWNDSQQFQMKCTHYIYMYRRHATDRAYLGFKWFSTRWVKPFLIFFLKLYLVNEMRVLW